MPISTTSPILHSKDPLLRLTPAQQKILRLIYTYRFLTREHIQSLMHHKDRKTINVWLKDLYDHQYLGRIYGTTPWERTRPAVYFLARNGVRYLKEYSNYPTSALHQRYYEAKRSHGFVERCLIVADYIVAFDINRSDTLRYDPVVPSEYSNPTHPSYFLNEIGPSLAWVKNIANIDGLYRGICFLEVIDATLPRMRFRKRLRDYIQYLDQEEWRGSLPVAPVVLILCPDKALLYYALRMTRLLLEDYDVAPQQIRFATRTDLKRNSVYGVIWRTVKPLDD